jgi:hypothetical protein
MGDSQSISMLTYGVDDTVLPSDPVNVNFRNFIDNYTKKDDGLYVQDEELLSIVFNIISNSKGVVLRSILNMVDDRLGKKAKVSRFVYPRKSYYGGRIQSVLHRFLTQRIMYIEGVKQMSALQRFILEDTHRMSLYRSW